MVLFNDEKTVFDKSYSSILPKLLLILGAIMAGISLLIMISEGDETLIAGLIPGAILVIVGLVLNSLSGFRLVITTKRVIQEGPFNQFVSIPLNHVSVVSARGHQVHIGAANGSVNVGIPDSGMVCDTVAGLVNQLQTMEPVAHTETPVYGSWQPGPEQPAARFWVCDCGAKNREAASVCSGCGKPHA